MIFISCFTTLYHVISQWTLSFNKLIIYDLLLIALKLMAVFGQYIEIKLKTKIKTMKIK